MGSGSDKNLLINLISSKAGNVGKAIRMGRKFVAAGWEVTLFLNVDGVAVLDPILSKEICPVADKPVADLLEAFLAEGGKGLVGAECLKLASLRTDRLPPGMGIAEFSLVEDLLGTPGIQTMTW